MNKFQKTAVYTGFFTSLVLIGLSIVTVTTLISYLTFGGIGGAMIGAVAGLVWFASELRSV